MKRMRAYKGGQSPNAYDTNVFVEALPDKNHAAKAKAMPDEAGVTYILSCWIDQIFAP